MGLDEGLLKIFEFREDQNSTSHETDAIVLFNQTTSTKRNLQLWGLQSLVLLLIIGDLVAGKMKSIMVDVLSSTSIRRDVVDKWSLIYGAHDSR